MPDSRFTFPKSVVKAGSAEAALLERLDPDRMPRHLAVIMDGNGRWAKQRGLPRVMGHREGAKSVREVVESSARLDIEVLTLFAFSVENWKRPQEEVDALMKMLSEFLRKEIPTLLKNDIRFQPLGRWRELPPETVADIEQAMAATASCRKMLFQVALNYSGRAEIVDCCREIATAAARGEVDPDLIDEEFVAQRLYNPSVPDPDLLIRTSGEQRISNFLLWEIAYTELHITPTFWPDFRIKHLLQAILDFQSRDRRFGGLNGEGAQ